MKRLLVGLVCLQIAGAGLAWPCEDYLPPDHGFVNVKTDPHCRLKGDGVADDSAALQACLIWYGDHNKADAVAPQSRDTLFFPNSHYKLTAGVKWIGADGTGRAYTAIRGESKAGVVFEVPANTPAFSDPNAQQVLFEVGQAATRASTFNTDLIDFTIRIGDGNTGLIALLQPGNNVLRVENVDILANPGQCAVGMWLGDRYGPMIVQDLRVEGCDFGVLGTASYYSATFVRPRFKANQLGAMAVSASVVAVKDLVSDQPTGAPCFRFLPVGNTAASMVEVLGAHCSGGKPGAAILSDPPSGAENRSGKGHFRDFVAEGSGYLAYQRNYKPTSSNPAKNHQPDLAAVAPPDLILEPTVGLTPGAALLRLTLPDHPHQIHPNPSDWTNVSTYGPGDAAPALEAKINSAKTPVVYLVGGHLLGSTMHICNPVVKRIVGFDQDFKQLGSKAVSPIWSICDGQTIELNNLNANQSTPSGAFPGDRTVMEGGGHLIITNATHQGPVAALHGATVSAQNTCCGGYRIDGGALHGYQLNVENDAAVDIDVRRGEFVALGLKHEGGDHGKQYYFEQARAGIFGTFLHCSAAYTLKDRPPITVVDSELEAFGVAGMSGCKWQPFLRAVDGGVERFLEVGGANRGTGASALIHNP